VAFDTAHGKAEVTVTVENKRCVSSKWITKRPRFMRQAQRFALDEKRTIQAALINSGLPYVVARAADLGAEFQDERKLGAAGALLSRAAGQQMPLRDFGMDEDADAYLVMLVGDLADDGTAKAAQVQAAWISPSGSVARMPSGTGALSVGAYFAESGELPLGTRLAVTSPTDHMLEVQIDEASASVGGSVDIIGVMELVSDPRG